MESTQERKWDMYGVNKQLVANTSAAIKARMYGFADANDAFVAEAVKLAGYLRTQDVDRKGLAKSKEEIRAEVEIFNTEMCAKLMALAVKTGNVVLYEEVNYKISAFMNFSDTKLVTTSENILEKVIENEGGLADYEVTSGTVADYTDVIESYRVAKPKPRGGIQTKKYSTQQIKSSFKLADGHLATMDGMVRTLQFTEVDFYKNYFISRKINGPGHSLMSCRGKIVDAAGAPVPLVLMTCETLGLNRKATRNGTFVFRNGVDGPHMVKFSRPSFGTVTQEITLYAGERTEVTVIMTAH